MTVEEQIVIIYCGVQGLLNSVQVSKIKECEENLLSIMRQDFSSSLNELRNGKLTDQVKNDIERALEKAVKNYN